MKNNPGYWGNNMIKLYNLRTSAKLPESIKQIAIQEHDALTLENLNGKISKEKDPVMINVILKKIEETAKNTATSRNLENPALNSAILNTLNLIKPYQQHKNPSISAKAKNIIESLTSKTK